MTEYPTDFFLPKELRGAREAAVDDMADLLERFVARALEVGMPEEEATTVIVDTLVKAAASYAIIVRVEMLSGDPDPNRWRAVTDDAFNWAIDNYRNFKIEEIFRQSETPADPQNTADPGEGIDRPGPVKTAVVSKRTDFNRLNPAQKAALASIYHCGGTFNATAKTSMPEPLPPSTPGDDSANAAEGTRMRQPVLTRKAFDLLTEEVEVQREVGSTKLAAALQTLLDWHGEPKPEMEGAEHG